jgi:hypothetical protein
MNPYTTPSGRIVGQTDKFNMILSCQRWWWYQPILQAVPKIPTKFLWCYIHINIISNIWNYIWRSEGSFEGSIWIFMPKNETKPFMMRTCIVCSLYNIILSRLSQRCWKGPEWGKIGVHEKEVQDVILEGNLTYGTQHPLSFHSTFVLWNLILCDLFHAFVWNCNLSALNFFFPLPTFCFVSLSWNVLIRNLVADISFLLPSVWK